MKNQELQLTDLINAQTLQDIQDAFSRMSGMASVATDEEGVPVTRGTRFTDFCTMCRSTEIGRKKCELCDITFAQATLDEGNSNTFRCHAGIIVFSAPILAGGTIVGSFSSGQVLNEEPDENVIKEEAFNQGLDPDEYYEAALKIPIVSKEKVEHAANFLFTIANVLSDMAYGKYIAIQANEEVEKAAKMKTDFLANMSHEIRTPMNAVIGMAELALRENLTDSAKSYITQIRSSGKALLAIINDILDFSKIESGKMNIIEDEYEPMSLFVDVANIIMTRLQDKNVELILDIDPNIPESLIGDSLRIRQILINLLNNATKFTQIGQIRLTVEITPNPYSSQELLLNVCIEDTGIGIKKKDLEKIFTSFEQVDSKRNRNVEGTGLGLTICRNLLKLMNGRIWVESEYGVGSKFYFSLPQKIKNANPSIKIKESKKIAAVAVIKNDYVKNQFKKDMERLRIPYCLLHTADNLENDVTTLCKKAPDRTIYLFIDQEIFTGKEEAVVRKLTNVQSVLISGFFDQTVYNIPNLSIMKKPLSILSTAIIFNHEERHELLKYTGNNSADFGFIAPQANVLVVDDNPVNLTVTQGLLSPLKMNIDTAISGRVALDKITKKSYDLIFMDHMMPEIDGIETTRLIRKNFPHYKDIPIIALTANALADVKDMFLKEGLDDFIPKPIEMRTITAKIKQWLPVEKIQRADTDVNAEKKDEGPLIIGDLDTEKAISLLGSKELYLTVIKEYYRVIPQKIDAIKEYETEENFRAYTIEVHALKSSSRQIGAMILSEKAAFLEDCGNKEDAEKIHALTDEMLELYDSYIPVLEPFCSDESDEDNSAKAEISQDQLFMALDTIKEAADNLDQDTLESTLEELKAYKFDDAETPLFKKLKSAIENIDTDGCIQIADEWKALKS